MHIRGVEVFTVTDDGLISAVTAYWGDEDVTFGSWAVAHRGVTGGLPSVSYGQAGVRTRRAGGRSVRWEDPCAPTVRRRGRHPRRLSPSVAGALAAARARRRRSCGPAAAAGADASGQGWTTRRRPLPLRRGERQPPTRTSTWPRRPAPAPTGASPWGGTTTPRGSAWGLIETQNGTSWTHTEAPQPPTWHWGQPGPVARLGDCGYDQPAVPCRARRELLRGRGRVQGHGGVHAAGGRNYGQRDLERAGPAARGRGQRRGAELPNAYLFSVSCTSTTSCVAVGRLPQQASNDYVGACNATLSGTDLERHRGAGCPPVRPRRPTPTRRA